MSWVRSSASRTPPKRAATTPPTVLARPSTRGVTCFGRSGSTTGVPANPYELISFTRWAARSRGNAAALRRSATVAPRSASPRTTVITNPSSYADVHDPFDHERAGDDHDRGRDEEDVAERRRV